ncbi:MAG: hypothetical protein WCO13_05210 [Bacteroidota bacterium]
MGNADLNACLTVAMDIKYQGIRNIYSKSANIRVYGTYPFQPRFQFFYR